MNFRRLLLMTICLLVLLLGLRGVELVGNVRDFSEISAIAAEDTGQGNEEEEEAKEVHAEPEAEAHETSEDTEDTEGSEEHAAETAGPTTPDEPAPDIAANPLTFTPSEIDVLQQLSDRRQELETRERAISRKESLLKVSEERIEQKIAELNDLHQEMLGIRDEIKVALGAMDEKEAKELARLVKIYETMKPKDAARIFDALDMPVLLQVLSRMKEAKTAPILAAMQPEKAKQVTIQLVGRPDRPNVDTILNMPEMGGSNLPPLPAP